ncbi:MAG: WcaF family extracellular polysaccharide biosynthesis acetyltransferase [Halioglobus sp.]
MSSIRLDKFLKRDDLRGRSRLLEFAWLVTQALLVSSFHPFSWLRIKALTLFGAQIGAGVVIKPGVRVKFPWKLKIGDHTWIGEAVWIDNLANVAIGSHCCISQGTYLCTGSHDWSLPTFDLIVKTIELKDGTWLGAFSKVAPGVVAEEDAVLTMGSVATSNLDAMMVYSGNPAKAIKKRSIDSTEY